MNYKVLKRNSLKDSDGYEILPIRPEDIESIRVWRNEQRDVLRQKGIIQAQEQTHYFEKTIWPTLEELQPKQILFSFLYQGTCIGYGGLTSIDWEYKRAEISFLVETARVHDQELYDKDYSHFLSLLAKITFEDLGFQRLYAETFDFREYHMRILEKFGLKQEGVLRKHVFKKGKWCDSIMHGLLREEYKSEK